MLDHTYAKSLVDPSLPSTPAILENVASTSSLSEGLSLAEKYLSGGVKDSTHSQYDRVYLIWRHFCAENGLPELDAGHAALAACLSITMDQSKSLSKVTMLSAAIANQHRIHLKPSPTSHESISLLFRGFRLAHSKLREPVMPMSPEILRQMIGKIYQPQHGCDGLRASPVLWRTVWRAVIEFYSLWRYSDVIKLKRSDLSFEQLPSAHLKITFTGGKNDLFSEAGARLIASDLTDTKNCPVQLTRHYLQFLGSSHTGFLVSACRPDGHPDGAKPLIYTAALADLRKLLNDLGYDGNLYGEHSGKRGAASHAIDSGMSVDTLQRLGGWRSSTMPNKYVDLSTRNRLEMSKVLLKKL